MSIYDQIKHDIAQEYYQQNYSNDGQRFVAWYLRNIKELDPSDAGECITDGTNDKQIDAVYICEDEQKIYIIQGKFFQNGKVGIEALNDIYLAWTHLKNLQNVQENANNRLAGKAGAIFDALNQGYDLCFELIITPELSRHVAVTKEAERIRQEMADDEKLSAALSVIGGHALHELYMQIIGNGSNIQHDFPLEPGMFMQVVIDGKKAVIAILSLRKCLNIPHIQDGLLFRRNVRQSLGNKVKVNKDIAQSLQKNPGEFFFMHNGITAICSSLEIEGSTLHTKGLSVVNGCQSLTTIYSHSIAINSSQEEGYIIFKFYEIDDNERADTISTSTNSQNAVKLRDLRSNDRHVLELKRAYEHCYTDGQFITKRGEKPNTGKNSLHVMELNILGKLLLSWYMHKPNSVNEEAKIFGEDSFKRLFHRTYTPESLQALNELHKAVISLWKKDTNTLQLRDELISHKAVALFMHIFAVSALLCEMNKAQNNTVPSPYIAVKLMHDTHSFDEVIRIAGECVNEAFIRAFDETGDDETFDPVKWLKSSKSVNEIRAEIRRSLRPIRLADRETIAELKEKLKMSKRDFEPSQAAN